MNTTTETKPRSQSNVSIINLERFKSCVLFSICLRKFGNTARVKDMTKLQEYLRLLKADDSEPNGAMPLPVVVSSDRVKSTKTLIRSERYDKLIRAMNALKSKVESMSMPSMFREGMFVSKQDNVPIIEAELKAGWASIEKQELADFLKGLPGDIEAARSNPVKKGGLGPLFNEADYDVDKITKAFSVEWYWMALSVPENIPDELKAEANEKFKRRMEDAAQEIENALRSELLELISHASERLTTEPGAEPKVFRNSITGNLIQFLNTFDSRDLFGDERLKAIVDKARAVMLDDKGNAKIDAQKLRDYGSVRKSVSDKFAEIKTELAGLVEEQGRKLDLSE